MATKHFSSEYPIQILREDLRQSAVRHTTLLSRSVGRLTSCDVQPCLEYHQEIAREYAIIDHLLYIQRCRNALEQCIGSGTACLRYRWRDGRVTDTAFRRTAPGRIRVTGLLAEPAARTAA